MIYALVRSVVSMALRGFYEVEVARQVTDLGGPVMFVGNHPNSLIDPAMVFVITDRPVTFLAREPLFRIPILGWLLKALGALPVFRKQDHPGLMAKNEGTLDAAAGALAQGLAITIFPEGKTHSDPQLSEIKTGCARIALKVVQRGQALRIVPVGLTYAEKHRFRSKVHVEVGEPILVERSTLEGDEHEQAWVRALTERVAAGLQAVTINLESWEDLALVETADALFALRHGLGEQDAGRLRLFAKGAALLRDVDGERFDDLKEDVLSYRRRLEVWRASPGEVAMAYQGDRVAAFIVRNLLAVLLGFPLFVLGMALFFMPFLALKAMALAVPVARERVATMKLVSAMVMVPTWWALLSVAGWWAWGLTGGVTVASLALPLAIFTRYFYERRQAALADALAFLKVGNREKFRGHLLGEGERLQEEIQRIVDELKPRLSA